MLKNHCAQSWHSETAWRGGMGREAGAQAGGDAVCRFTVVHVKTTMML